jgi:nicotinamide mononucleotide transporter
MGLGNSLAILAVTVTATFAFGYSASNLHAWMPGLFPLPSAYPYLDSFVLTSSVAATYLMVQKKVECWAVWILTDAVATYLYVSKGILFVGLEYFVFCLIAMFGLWHWHREAKQQAT